MTSLILRKSTLALLLLFMTASVNKTNAQQTILGPSHPAPTAAGDPGGGDPEPPPQPPSLVGVHLA